MRAIVVGAGVSGAFAADALRRRMGSALELDMLERESRTGGRVLGRRVSGVGVEAGASLFHSSNRLMVGSARDLGLDVVPAGSGGSLGVWDGTRLVVRTTGHGRADSVRLLARYGVRLVAAGRQVAAVIRQLDGVYPRLAAGKSWDAPHQMWRELGLDEHARRRADTRFPPSRFRTEFVDGVSRNNYAQDVTRLNELVELVSLAGAGLGGGTLLKVGDGNAAVPDGLIQRSGARLRTGATVRSVERVEVGWRVHAEGLPSMDADVVVLAAPLELSGIRLAGAPAPAPRTFVTVHVTFVVGALRAAALGTVEPAPTFTLTTAAAGSMLSIERMGDTAGGPLHKVFSTEQLDDDRINDFFVAAHNTRMSWSAYPALRPTADPPFRLAPGLYYTGAMEYAVSTMETQAIAGVATANLAARDLPQLTSRSARR